MSKRNDDHDHPPSSKGKDRLPIAPIAIAVLGVGGVWFYMTRGAKSSTSTAPSASTSVVAVPSGEVVKLPLGDEAPVAEIWFRNPEEVAGKLIPRLVPGGAGLIKPTFAQLLKNGMPAESQADVDALDFDKPLGYAILPSEGSTSMRFVVAATVKDAKSAKGTLDAYAKREGAVAEKSQALGVDTYRGNATGRYMALVGDQLVLGSDKRAIEEEAPRLGAELASAKTQAHSVVVRAPKGFLEGPFAQWAQAEWLSWSAPQLGGAVDGPAKKLFDDVATAAKTTFVGAESLELFLDFDEKKATIGGGVRAKVGSPFSSFLAAYPTGSASVLGEAPRDALGILVLDFPPSFVETARRFLVTPPPGADIPPDLQKKTDEVFGELSSELDGELVISSVADPAPVGSSIMRFKVKDEAGAKKAAHDFATFFAGGLGQPIPTSAISGDGAVGEAMELRPPTPQGMPAGSPPMPLIGFAWMVRDKYAYVVRGGDPKARVLKAVSNDVKVHLAGDAITKSTIDALPGKVALATVIAPLRPDTPLAAAMGIPPVSDSITLSAEPTAQGLVLKGSIDLDLAIQVVAPMLMRQGPPGTGAGGGGGGGGGGAPPPMPSGPPPTIATTMPTPTVVTPKPKPPTTTAPKPPVTVAPPPTGYVLPLPKPGGGGP